MPQKSLPITFQHCLYHQSDVQDLDYAIKVFLPILSAPVCEIEIICHLAFRNYFSNKNLGLLDV